MPRWKPVGDSEIMDTRPPDRDDRRALTAQTELAAASLASGRTIDAWSRTLALGSLLWLIWPDLPDLARRLLALSLAGALLQSWWAWRVALDARIFATWAASWRDPATAVADDLQRFDRALGQWRASGAHPRGPGDDAETARSETVRPLADRLRGARRLLVRQIITFAFQGSCALAAIATGWPS